MTSPTLLGLFPSFGYGDRLGLATPGHLAAHLRCGGEIQGIFAQQSIREMARTERQPAEVMSCAAGVLEAEGFGQPWGADADHLKTQEDVDRTLGAGFTFFTIDPSDHVDQSADNYTPEQVLAKYTDVPWAEAYLGQTIRVSDELSITFDELTVKRAAVKYGRAIRHAIELAGYIKSAAEKLGRVHEIEISVDETDQPTTHAEHYIVADQLLRSGMALVSLAPRFIGELEKGIDYIGDLDALDASFRDHAAIAQHLGPYKLSLHSGSDKLSMYTMFARATRGRFHVKTAGTSYLEALRVVSRHDEKLFREVIRFSRDRYEVDRATYHVHATLDHAPPEDVIADRGVLEQTYLEQWANVAVGCGFTQPGRQILHCTFGSVMTDPTLGSAVRDCLTAHPETYREVLDDHFGRHLDALVAGMS